MRYNKSFNFTCPAHTHSRKPTGTRASVNEEYRTVDGRETAASAKKKVTERANTRRYTDVTPAGLRTNARLKCLVI